MKNFLTAMKTDEKSIQLAFVVGFWMLMAAIAFLFVQMCCYGKRELSNNADSLNLLD